MNLPHVGAAYCLPGWGHGSLVDVRRALPGDEVHLCLRTLQTCTDCVSGALDLPHLAASRG